MKKALTILTFLILSVSYLSAQDGVKWYTIEEADALLKTDPKPVFIDTYTDWCSWCVRLDKDTFSDPVIAAYLNDNFIPVKFNAESKEPVTFLGKEFINDGKAGKAHQLAVALLRGKMGYPQWYFFLKKVNYCGLSLVIKRLRR